MVDPLARFSLREGERILRKELHDRYGGARMQGITSTPSGDVFIFSGEAGRKIGYVDGWAEDGSVYEYTGAGRHGDQNLSGSNETLLEGAERGAVRLFEGTGGRVRYAGRFQLDHQAPYRWEVAHDQTGKDRRIIVFRLLYMPDPLSAPISAQDAMAENAAALASGIEGRVQMRSHLTRERDVHLVYEAKRRWAEKHNGRLPCEVCEAEVGVSVGRPMIHAHHLFSLGERPDGGSRTRIDELAMLCPNCHAEIHLPRRDGNYRTVEELRSGLLI
jgi:5-methylcytosine-specific restriction protein A